MNNDARFVRQSRRMAALVALLGWAVLLAMPGTVSAQQPLTIGFGGGFGSTVGPDGALYVAQGALGRVSRVDPRTGVATTFASGLPSAIAGFGGPVDVAFIGGTAYVLVSTVGDPLLGAQFIDGIYRVDGPEEFTIIADLGAWSASHAPDPADFDYFLVNGVQYALEVYHGGFLVTDGHHNRVLRVDRRREISEFKTFGNIVPTGLDVYGEMVYVSELGPVPHNPEDGKVISIDAKSRRVREIASGARMIVDVESGRGQTLFALSQGIFPVGSDPGTPANPNTGSLVRVNRDGSFTSLVDPLSVPTSLQIIGNTAYVVTMFDEIWEIPNIARPPFGRAHGRRDGHGFLESHHSHGWSRGRHD